MDEVGADMDGMDGMDDMDDMDDMDGIHLLHPDSRAVRQIQMRFP